MRTSPSGISSPAPSRKRRCNEGRWPTGPRVRFFLGGKVRKMGLKMAEDG